MVDAPIMIVTGGSRSIGAGIARLAGQRGYDVCVNYVAAADRALRAIEEIRRGLSPRLQPLGIVVNRARVQSLEHQFRIKELRDMFGPLVLAPQLPERTSLQQAQGAAKPLHVWPGESSQEMARNFDQLLDRVMRTARIGEYAQQ